MAKEWIDENGIKIPVSRVTPVEKLRESELEKLLKEGLALEEKLAAYKQRFATSIDKIYNETLKAAGIDPKERKGNFECYNFNRTTRASVDVNETIEFDDAAITIAEAKFDEFLQNNTGGLDEVVRDVIKSAFKKSRGKVDAKQILRLLPYRSRIPADKYPAFHDALDSIEKGMHRKFTAKYYRIARKMGEDQFEAVNLNFSNI